MKLFPDIQIYQVVSCFWPIFGPLWHVEQGTKQTLAHVLCDMHDIKAVRHKEDLPVRQVPENRPRFPYLQQRLWRLSLLSRRWALFPIFQQLIDFLAAPLAWRSTAFGCTIEQIFAFSPWVIIGKPPSMSHEHGFRRPGISI